MTAEITAEIKSLIEKQEAWADCEATKEQLIHRGKQAAAGLERAKDPRMVALYKGLLEAYRMVYRIRFSGIHPDIAEGIAFQQQELAQEQAAFASDPDYQDYVAAQAVQAAEEIVAPKPVPDATYTVSLADGSHITVQLETQPDDATFAPGSRIASYMVGSDNSKFKGFAFVNGTKVNLWKSHRTPKGEVLKGAVLTVLGSPDRGARFMEAYALMSGKCSVCGRKLTVPASIHRGLGPDCAGKIGY